MTASEVLVAGQSGFGFPFLSLGGAGNPFMELMADPKVLEILRVMCGDWLRLDHAYGSESLRAQLLLLLLKCMVKPVGCAR